MRTNYEQTPGYGKDIHCEKAREYIKKWCANEDLEVHFLVGGTQANTTVISSVLRPHQGVISAQTGHINVHETGAIEATGHKVIAAESSDGRNDLVHVVQPGMVYISHPTENGTTYCKKDLQEISAVCRECKLPLFLDGARLGYGLAAVGNDLRLPDIAQLCDVFYIGGTKVGALFGEAVVIADDNLKKDFRYHIKQRGGMLAKGRLLGIQFETLFKDGLYFEIAEHAVQMAMLIKNAFAAKGYTFLYASPTNQQFPIVPAAALQKLADKYSFSTWAKIDAEYTAVRFCTSWATQEENVKMLIEDIENL